VISGAWMWVVWTPIIVVVALLQVRRRAPWWHTLGVLALITYAFWIASAAFFPIPTEHGPGLSMSAVNLVPFRQLVRSFGYLSQGQIIRQHGGNFLLLVPFTLLVPSLWPRLRAWRWALAIGVGASAAIELLQLAISVLVGQSFRSTDIDDVILNTAGALFGYALFVGARGVLHALRREASEPAAGKREPDRDQEAPS